MCAHMCGGMLCVAYTGCTMLCGGVAWCPCRCTRTCMRCKGPGGGGGGGHIQLWRYRGILASHTSGDILRSSTDSFMH